MAGPTDVPDVFTFQQLRGELLDEIRTRIRSVESHEAQRIVPRDVFISKSRQLKQLYCAADNEYERSHPRESVSTCRNHFGVLPACSACGEGARSEEYCKVPEDFWLAVVGESSESSCAMVLTILLTVQELTPASGTWETFIDYLNPARDSKSTRLCDSFLPFKDRTDIQAYLGDEFVDTLWRNQLDFFPVDLQSRFDEQRDHLYRSLRNSEALITCRTDPNDREQATDEFYSDAGLRIFVEDQERVIKDLYTEYYKYMYASTCPGEQAARYQFKLDAEAEATTFYEHIRIRPKIKIFTILILMSVGPASIAWGRFIHACQNSWTATEASPLEINDDSLPIPFETMKAKISSAPHEYQAFQGIQYAFCPVQLQERDQVDLPSNDFHLPLLSRQDLGSGTFGSVYRVTVKGEYFRGEDEELAMKVMKPERQQSEAEWANGKWLFQQPKSHPNIMMAVASLKLPDFLYIFFPLAECDLRQYMTKRVLEPPNGEDALRERLQAMIGVADALHYLQSDLRDPSDQRSLICIHEDLKAANILVVHDNDGLLRLKITDFNISTIKFGQQNSDGTGSTMVQRNKQFKSQPDSLSNKLTNPKLGNNSPHFAPEADDSEIDAKVDIWAYGTVLAEFLSWLWDGAAGLERFERARDTGDSLSYRKARVGFPVLKEQIAQWFLNEVIPNASGEQKLIFQRSWALLEHGLLVCDKDQRANISLVSNILTQICNGQDVDVCSKIGQSKNIFEDPAHMNGGALAQHNTTIENHRGPLRAGLSAMRSRLLPRRIRANRHAVVHMPQVDVSPTKQLVGAIDAQDMGRFTAALANLSPSAIQEAEQDRSVSLITQLMDREHVDSICDYMIADLIKRGADTDLPNKPRSILHTGSELGLTETVRTLLTLPDWKARLEDNERDRTPLKLAVYGRHEDVVAILLRAGADVHFDDKHNSSILHFVVHYSNRIPVNILSSNHRELLNARNVEGETPLHRCARKCRSAEVSSAKRLLNEPVHGADADKRFAVNVKDNADRSPLFVVTNELRDDYRWEMVNLLLRHGAATTTADLGLYAKEYGLGVG